MYSSDDVVKIKSIHKKLSSIFTIVDRHNEILETITTILKEEN